MILNFTTKVKQGKLKGFTTNFVEKIKSGTKIHTIRDDAKGRWKPNNKIHFASGGYKPGRVFHEGQCTKIQNIEVKWFCSYTGAMVTIRAHSVFEAFLPSEADPYITYANNLYAIVIIDGIAINKAQVQQLAINDGLESSENFFKWFDKDFTGKIIHWT